MVMLKSGQQIPLSDPGVRGSPAKTTLAESKLRQRSLAVNSCLETVKN